MGIVVNVRTLDQRMTGVQRYARELLARIGPYVRQIRPPPRVPGHLWEQALLPFHLGSDLLFSPANTGPVAIRRQVVTIHDASTLDHPEWFSREFATWYRWLLPRLVRRARRVLTDSNYQRKRLLHHAGLGADCPHVVVVPLGVDLRFRPAPGPVVTAACAKYGIDRPYLLVVGSLEPRKNLAALFAAWAKIAMHHPDQVLAIAGASSGVFRDQGYAQLPPQTRLLGYVADDDLPALYSGADAFLYPSIYEGFGLPPLEAMACGAPVLAGDNTSLPEVLGDAAQLVDTTDINRLTAALHELLASPGLRAELGRRGRIRAAEFTWEATAKATMSVLEDSA